jgi:hypothetical protein
VNRPHSIRLLKDLHMFRLMKKVVDSWTCRAEIAEVTVPAKLLSRHTRSKLILDTILSTRFNFGFVLPDSDSKDSML